MGRDSEKRVVVTGLGSVTAVGQTVPEFWDSLIQGRSGIRPITLFDPARLEVRIAGQLEAFDPEPLLGKKEARRMDRFSQFGVVAGLEAATHAGLDLDAGDAERAGVMVGTGIGGIITLEEQFKVLANRGPDRVSPFAVPMMLPNMASGQVSIALHARGPNVAPTSACSSAADSIGIAAQIIRRGDAEIMIAGGAEAPICEISVAGFHAARALSTRNEEPTRASRPFDIHRDGFVMGEGAGVLVLESSEHAEARGAEILAELIGYASVGDAYHVTQPAEDGDGGRRAMTAALKDARTNPSDVQYINAHGTSTPLNDRLETLAIKNVFGEAAHAVSISSTKSMTGHLMGAAGAIEAIATIQAIRTGVLPPTINLEIPDPDCDLDYTPNQAREREVRIAISNSMGFGGHNACLVFRRWER